MNHFAVDIRKTSEEPNGRGRSLVQYALVSAPVDGFPMETRCWEFHEQPSPEDADLAVQIDKRLTALNAEYEAALGDDN